jgi:hypothetical protein
MGATAMGRLKVLDRTGHRELKYGVNQQALVQEAEETFDELTQKGWLGYATLEDGTNVKVRRFDSEANITLIPPVMGG